MLTFIPRYDSNNEDVCKGLFLKYGPPYFQLAKGEQSFGDSNPSIVTFVPQLEDFSSEIGGAFLLHRFHLLISQIEDFSGDQLLKSIYCPFSSTILISQHFVDFSLKMCS